MEDKMEHTIVEKELLGRKEEIKDDLQQLFEKNMKITDWDIPEPNGKEAALMLLAIFADKIEELKQDVLSGKYDNY